MNKLSVKIERKPAEYEIFLDDSLKELSQFIRKKFSTHKIVVITEDKVDKLHGSKLRESLSGLNLLFISLPEGESSKSRALKEETEDKLLSQGFGRDTLFIAFGGGVVGDFSGFLASTFNRGCDFIQVPTTLLAIVDASIGGKTGINTEHGKNLIGTIWQPSAVFIDLSFLKTLPEDEFLSGLAEIIKIAAVQDASLFEFIEENLQDILERDDKILLKIIQSSIQLKIKAIQKDESESGARELLNFGHTIGHAIESCSNFSINHGFCVSIGMAVEARISTMKNLITLKDEERLIRLLKKAGLPTSPPDIDSKKIIEKIKSDKKSRLGIPRFVLLKKIGEGVNGCELEESLIAKAMESCR